MHRLCKRHILVWPKYSGLYIFRYRNTGLLKCVWLHQPCSCSNNTICARNLRTLLMLWCILRASWVPQVYHLGSCYLANMAPVKIQRLWFSTYILIVIQSLFLQLVFHCFLLFACFFFPPSQQPSGTFFCQPSFCSLPGPFQTDSRREWISSCHWKMSLFPAGKAVKYNYSLICYTFLLGCSYLKANT